MLYSAFIELLDLGLAGYSIFGLLGLALILALVLAVTAAMPESRERGVWLRAIGGAAGICFGLGLAATAAAVFAGWRTLFEAETFRTHRPPPNIGDQFLYAEQAGAGLLAGAAATLPFALFLGIAAALWAMHPTRRAELSSILRAILRASLAAVAIAAAIGVMAYAWRTPNMLEGCTISTDLACFARALPGPTRGLSDARVGVIAVAMLGLALFTGAALWNRQGPGLGRGDTLAAALIFVVGLVSWIGTRGIAEDGRRPLSLRGPHEHGCPTRSFEPERLPRVTRCSSGQNIALVELSAGGLLVSHEPSTLEQLSAELRSRSENWSGGSRPPVLISAEADLPYAVAKPLLVAIQEAWSPEIDIMVLKEPQIERTATLGDIPRTLRCCATPLRLDAPGAAPAATWGELAAAAQAPMP